jgi:ADP-ribose pyrophosphatase YjhB (NUDIX family)
MRCLPGGKLQKGESPRDGVIREVHEETGYQISIIDMIGTYYKPMRKELAFSFTAKIK